MRDNGTSEVFTDVCEYCGKAIAYRSEAVWGDGKWIICNPQDATVIHHKARLVVSLEEVITGLQMIAEDLR